MRQPRRINPAVLPLVIALLLLWPSAMMAQPVELTMLWWVGDGDDAGSRNERAILRIFEEHHPDIKVNVIFADWDDIPDRALTMYAAGIAPDVMWVREDSLFDLASNGVLADLGPFIARDPDWDEDNFVPGVLDSAKVNGIQYALHRDVWVPSIFYNASWFAEAGLAPPAEGWTFDDLLDIAIKLTDHTRNRFGLGNIESARNSVIYSYGGRFMNEDQTEFTFHAPAAMEAARLMHSFPWVHHAQPQPGDLNDWHEPQWVRGEVAMQFWGPWAWPTYQETLEFDWDLAPPLHGPAGAFGHVDGLLLGVSSTTQHPEEAWKLVRFLGYDSRAQTEHVRRGMASPTVRYPETLQAFYESENAPTSVENYIKTLLTGRSDVPRLPRRVIEIIDEAYDQVMEDAGEIGPIIQEAARRAQAVLEEERARIRQ